MRLTAEADARKRPRRVARKIAARLNYLHTIGRIMGYSRMTPREQTLFMARRGCAHARRRMGDFGGES